MKSKQRISSFFLIVSALVLFSGNSLFGAKIKVMPFGDSITGTTCWYPFLWVDLLSGKDSVTFVGTVPLNNGLGVTCANIPYYGSPQGVINTEGHSGYSTGNLVSGLPGWISSDNPDILIMHAGTNNFWNGGSASMITSTLADYTTMLKAMRANNPNVKIILCQIIPMDYTSASLAATNMLDDSIPSWAAAHSTIQSPIVVVDLRSGFDMNSFYADAAKVHPNSAGSKWMADQVYPVLVTMLHSSSGIVDTTKPVVSFTAPSNGSNVNGTVPVSANASDNVAVIGVQFQLNGVDLGGEIVTTPYKHSWNTTLTANGTYTLSAIASDAAGNKSTSSISVTVANAADTTHPVVSFTSPSNGASLTNIVTLNANASDNVGVVGVQFRLNGANLGNEVTVPPYNLSWNTSLINNGNYTLSAIARDAAGNMSTASVSVTIANVIDTTAPSVSITAPANGDSISGTVAVTATSSDDVGVVGVQFKLNGVSLGNEDLTAPYTYSWNTTLDTNGTYNLSAVARDAAGHQTTAAIAVIVANAAPPPQAGSALQIVAVDNFNRADQPALSGSKWGTLLNQPGKGTMRLVSNQVQAYDSLGVGYGGGVVWDSLVSKGSGVALNVAQVAGTNAYTSLFIYARMAGKDLSTGNGYRFRYVDNPGSNATLAIQKVTNGTNGTDLVTTTHQVGVGDTLKFVVQNDAASTLVAYVNGTQVLSTVDTTYNPSNWYYWIRGMVAPTQPSFDNFILLGKTPIPLPIQLSSFTASAASQSSVSLSWTTVSEVNNYGFYVERRSQSQTTFQTVSSFIPGAGTSLTEHQYAWMDTTVTVGTYYYRLKQIDLNGTFVYSSEIVMTVTGVTGVREDQSPEAFQLMQNYPNPFNPTTEITFSVDQVGPAEVAVFNMLGQQVATLFEGTAGPGQLYRVSFDGSKVGTGVYMYRIKTNTHMALKKMVMVK